MSSVPGIGYRMAAGLITQERRAMGWNDEDERYMNHLDDVYNGRVIELYASATFVRYKEKKDVMPGERARAEDRHAADRLLIEIGQRQELARAKDRDRGKR